MEVMTPRESKINQIEVGQVIPDDLLLKADLALRREVHLEYKDQIMYDVRGLPEQNLGFLSPDGLFVGAGPDDGHSSAAHAIIIMLSLKEGNGYYGEGMLVDKLGWVKFRAYGYTSPSSVVWAKRMTNKQRKFVEGWYEKNNYPIPPKVLDKPGRSWE